jgi:hypothetical protein
MYVDWFRLMVFNAIFNNISIYRGGQFYWWRNRSTRRSMSRNIIFSLQIINKSRSHIIAYGKFTWYLV